MIASTNTCENLRLDLGSSPIVDPLLGSKSFSIVHDGAAYGRVDKVRRIAANSLATKSARVCWQGSWSRNCGVCDKCVQTQWISSLWESPIRNALIGRLIFA
jgi:7-cyano-7-deazaguanine synthase in queuosine biosynthesis